MRTRQVRACWGVSNGAAILKKSWAVSQLNGDLPHDPAVTLSSYTPREMKTCPRRNSYMDVLAELFFFIGTQLCRLTHVITTGGIFHLLF